MNTVQRMVRSLLRSRAKGADSRTPRTLWDFLNSSFGVFLLSSVLLGLLSFGYGKWRDYESRQEKLEQLDLEIALRIQTMDTMCSGAENNRYSNLVNVNKVMDGDPKSSFYVRKPLFNDFENKSLATLLWQLYLLLPGHERLEIKRAIADVNVIDRQIRQVRYAAANESAPTRRAKPKTEKDQEAQDNANDIFKKDYGQAEIYARIHTLASHPRWRDAVM